MEAGHGSGVFGPHAPLRLAGGWPGRLQQFPAPDPVVPPQTPELQHWHVGQSASEVHAPTPGNVVVVVPPPPPPPPPGSVVVGPPRLGGTAEIAEPQHATNPVSRQ